MKVQPSRDQSPVATSKTPGSIGVRIQTLPAQDQVTVLSRIAESRVGGPFASNVVRDLYDEMTLPTPRNVSDVLGKLAKKGLSKQLGANPVVWRLTPAGRQRSQDLMSDIDLAAGAAEAALTGSAIFGRSLHPLLPPALAPFDLIPTLNHFLARYPFETNVFAMTRFPGENAVNTDPIKAALEVAGHACELHGYHMHLASDRAMHENLWTNVTAHMWTSKYGLAFFEDLEGKGLNYNLTIEVGSMLMTGRRCALLKDRSIEKMPTDLVGHIYKNVDLDDVSSFAAAVHAWLRDDLAGTRCHECPQS